MRVEVYTRVVLTVIAVCLVWLSLGGPSLTLVGAQTVEPLLLQPPTIASGDDIGFRIERTVDGIALGRIVVRVDGRWIGTDAPVSVNPAR